MQFYKKVLLTLSGAGMMVSCVPLSLMTHPAQGKVVEKDEYNVYLDSNNDGLADACMYISGSTAKNNQCFFKDYIALGDTLKYRTTTDEPVILDADLYTFVSKEDTNDCICLNKYLASNLYAFNNIIWISLSDSGIVTSQVNNIFSSPLNLF